MRFISSLLGSGPRLFALIAIPFLTAVASAQAPKLRLSEVEDIAPTSYRADLTLDPDKPDFTGSIAIRLDVRKTVSTVWLNASKLAVQGASLNVAGRTLAARVLPGGDDYAGFQFDAPVPVGTAELQISYSGVVSKSTSGVFQAEDSGNRYILTQFESTDARDAFPCFDEPLYKVPWQLTLHVPIADSAVGNTPIVSESTSGTRKTYVFKETKPLPSYLVAFGVGPFEYVPAGFAGVNRAPVRIVTPKGRASEAKYAAEVTSTILTRLEDYFGIPFPYEKSDQVSVPATVGFGAMENAGMVTYGQTLILARPETDTLDRQRRYAEVAAHELSHQWFGDLVTTSWWNDIWLNEAFATWMEQKLLAEWKPEWKTRVEDVDTKLKAEDLDSLISARQIRQPIETKGDIGNAFDGITYLKGAAVIGMFETWMGPENFRRGVQSYMKQYAFRTTTAGDFLDSLSSAGKRDIATPFLTFLNQSGVPDVSVTLECGKAGPVAHLAQTRFLPVGSKGSADQTWQIPICLRYGTGSKGETACTLMSQAKMDVPLKAQTCPAWIDANADAHGYYRMDYQGGLLAALTAGNSAGRLSAAERVDLIGNVKAMTDAGKIAPADALGMVEVFHADAERDVVATALAVALAPGIRLVPDELRPNYQRFLQKNFQAKARELGWIPKAGETDDVRLLRPVLVAAIADEGGDADLAAQARQLAEQWLKDRKAVSPDVVTAVLTSAGYHGDADLYRSFLTEFQNTRDRQEQYSLLQAMISFRDPGALDLGMQAVLSKRVALADGFALLIGARGMPFHDRLHFDFAKAHLDELTKDHPSIFGFDFGSFLPYVGSGFCDAGSRNELQAFFQPVVSRYTGAPRILTQVLEGVDLCIANKKAQQPGVIEFLKRY